MIARIEYTVSIRNAERPRILDPRAKSFDVICAGEAAVNAAHGLAQSFQLDIAPSSYTRV